MIDLIKPSIGLWRSSDTI